MRVEDGFGLYAVLTKPIKGFDYLTRLLVDCDVRFIQLRMKDVPVVQVREIALMMREITQGTDSLFVINDDPTLAREVGADGVHIGQDDMPYDQVRSIVGPDMIVGISTHSPAQTRAACVRGPNYIGVGPVFTTPTKKNPDPVIGIEGMQEMLGVASVPAVAIGGIDLTNVRAVLEAGAKNFCMVRQIEAAEDPQRVLAEARRIYLDVWS